MPLEIRELQIKVTVNETPGQAGQQQVAGASKDKDEKEAIINQCIEQVMTILNDKKER